jgi:hypothetical protein
MAGHIAGSDLGLHQMPPLFEGIKLAAQAQTAPGFGAAWYPAKPVI